RGGMFLSGDAANQKWQAQMWLRLSVAEKEGNVERSVFLEPRGRVTFNRDPCGRAINGTVHLTFLSSGHNTENSKSGPLSTAGPDAKFTLEVGGECPPGS